MNRVQDCELTVTLHIVTGGMQIRLTILQLSNNP